MSTGKKIATGCGLGCLLLALAVGAVGTCGYLGVRNAMNHAEGIEVAYDELRVRHGDPGNHVPSADGRIDPSRIEAFLAIREELLAGGTDTVEKLRVLDDGAGAGLVDRLRAGMGFIPAIMDFMTLHGRTLLDHGMGLSEYAYLYVLGYLVLLGEDPGAGPGFVIATHGDGSEAGVHWSTKDTDRPGEEREGDARERINAVLRRVLQHQLDAAVAADVPADWVERLANEVDLMKQDWERLPWEDGLPTPVAESLAPYRAQLEATWSPTLNPLEMGFLEP